jgi:hypothetical protein
VEVSVTIRRLLLIATLALAWPATSQAQDFGILESAETINRGNFKFRLSPLVVFGKDSEDNEGAIAITAGYGFTDRFDIEGAVAFFDGVTFYGANAEYWVARNTPVDISVSGGFHRRTGERTDSFNGIDLTFLASGNVAPRLELYGGLDFAFEGIGADFDFKTVHFVPGIEYRITDDLDFVAELGLALNDNARHYLAGGLAFYIR